MNSPRLGRFWHLGIETAATPGPAFHSSTVFLKARRRPNRPRHHAASNTLYALIDNQPPAQDEAAEEGGLTPASFLDMSAEAFLALDNDTLQTYLDENGFQSADSAAAIKARVERAELSPEPSTITSLTECGVVRHRNCRP